MRVDRAALRRWMEQTDNLFAKVKPRSAAHIMELVDILDHCFSVGDSRAAVVLATSPGIVSAYSDEFDAVLLLGFPSELVAERGWTRGQRLIGVWTYGRGAALQEDLTPGPRATGRWTRGGARIADGFAVPPTAEHLEKLASRVSDQEWQRAEQLGLEALARRPEFIRDGLPHMADAVRGFALEYDAQGRPIRGKPIRQEGRVFLRRVLLALVVLLILWVLSLR